jgi:hypothetical protein
VWKSLATQASKIGFVPSKRCQQFTAILFNHLAGFRRLRIGSELRGLAGQAIFMSPANASKLGSFLQKWHQSPAGLCSR